MYIYAAGEIISLTSLWVTQPHQRNKMEQTVAPPTTLHFFLKNRFFFTPEFSASLLKWWDRFFRLCVPKCGANISTVYQQMAPFTELDRLPTVSPPSGLSWIPPEWPGWKWPVTQLLNSYRLPVYWGFPLCWRSSTPPPYLHKTHEEGEIKGRVRWQWERRCLLKTRCHLLQ